MSSILEFTELMPLWIAGFRRQLVLQWAALIQGYRDDGIWPKADVRRGVRTRPVARRLVHLRAHIYFPGNRVGLHPRPALRCPLRDSAANDLNRPLKLEGAALT